MHTSVWCEREDDHKLTCTFSMNLIHCKLWSLVQHALSGWMDSNCTALSFGQDFVLQVVISSIPIYNNDFGTKICISSHSCVWLRICEKKELECIRCT